MLISKKAGCIILILCLAVGLCACGKSAAPAGTDQTADAGEGAPTPAADVETIADEAETETDTDIDADEPGESDVDIIHPIVFHKQLTCSVPGSWERGVNCEYDLFTLTKEDQEKYPRLAKAMAELATDMGARVLNDFSEMRVIMEERYLAASPDDEVDPDAWELVDTSARKVVRSDSVAFSFFCDNYYYYGGAHPYYSFTGYNFDSQTGQKLSCEDVVSDVDKLNEILFERVMEEYGDICLLNEDTVKEHLAMCKTGESDYEWLLGYEGVTFYFNPYSIAAFSAGMQLVYLSFEDYPELFVETYQKIPKNYIEPFCSYGDIYTDIDLDNKVEKVSATLGNAFTESEEWYAFINIDDECYTFSYPYSFGGDLYLVHYDGKCYIYSFMSNMGENESIQCYDLSDGTAKRVHRYALGSRVMVANNYIDLSETSEHGDESIAEYYSAYEVFTDPVNFRLSTWNDALSTCNGVVDFAIDEDGVPSRASDIYNVSRDWWIDEEDPLTPLTFTTKMELTMRRLDANGNVSEDITIPKGTALEYIRTDTKTYADFRLEDGSEVRALIRCDDYPQEICNEILEDAVDGTIFAG